MEYIYPIFISFIMIFLSELGDKTQLLVLSFTGKQKTRTILFGVALGSFFSHGIAILFGSALGGLSNSHIHDILEIITYSSFILIGLVSLIFNKKDNDSKNENNNLIKKLNKYTINYSIIIGITIAIGEFGDKTFLASIGLRYTISSLQTIFNYRSNSWNDY